MKRYLILTITVLFYFCAQSQGPAKAKAKKYPSLFWEISGNGLKKPSYLFGTMHVSSKIAFNLADSFYLAIKNSEVVALETNPETWQEDMNNYDLGSSRNRYRFNPGLMNDMPGDFLTIKTLRFGKYEKKLEVAMFSKPSMINNLLYRSQSDNTSDFEEDTYLDLYIYQTGKKLGKKVFSVPGPINSQMAQGALKLLKQGAKLVTSGEDVLEEFKVHNSKLRTSAPKFKNL